MIGRGRFARQLNGRGCFGVVDVEIEPNGAPTSIAVLTHGDGFRSQGSIEDVPERGYEDWKQGAVLGVAFALTTIGHPGCAVTITRIQGMTSDTNATIIAVAAMDAVWKAFAFTPDLAITSQIVECVVASQSKPINSVCIFW